MIEKELTQIKVTQKKQLNKGIYIIQFKRHFDFKAGQIVGITNIPELAPRLYSICSAPADAEISILFNVVETGELTPWLAKVTPGDKLWITGPQGKFIYNNEPAWWIATGTGIAPFYSMFKNDQRPFKLIHGGRNYDEFYFQDEFKSLPDYIRCSSHHQLAEFYPGRLTRYLNSLDEIPPNLNYYICGNTEMVVDVRNLLISRGIPYRNIITEIYF